MWDHFDESSPFLGVGWGFLGGEQEQMSSCHGSAHRGCGKPDHICLQPRVCQRPCTNQQRGVNSSVCNIHGHILHVLLDH